MIDIAQRPDRKSRTAVMAANATKRLWEIGDVVDVLEGWESAN